MTFKQFLKPDWRKIVLMIIIVILFHYLFFFTEELNKKACKPSELFPFMRFTGGICDIRLLPLFIILNPIISFLSYVRGLAIHQIAYFLIILIQLPYYYLLSCLIIWIYDKVKKK